MKEVEGDDVGNGERTTLQKEIKRGREMISVKR